jgi:hypothetical protein
MRLKAQKRFDDLPKGIHLLRNPDLNKGTAFTEEERGSWIEGSSSSKSSLYPGANEQGFRKHKAKT